MASQIENEVSANGFASDGLVAEFLKLLTARGVQVSA